MTRPLSGNAQLAAASSPSAGGGRSPQTSRVKKVKATRASARRAGQARVKASKFIAAAILMASRAGGYKSLAALQQRAAPARDLESDEERADSDRQVERVESESGGKMRQRKLAVEHHRAHALEDMRRRDGPGDVLQPDRQDRDRVVDRRGRREHEDRRPGHAFGAEPVAQQERADDETDAPAHRQQQDEEREQRQAEGEDRIVVKHDREQ